MTSAEQAKNKKVFHLKAYSLKELAEFYKVSTKTLSKWLKPYEEEIGLKVGWFYNVNQVKIITEKIGLPTTVEL